MIHPKKNPGTIFTLFRTAALICLMIAVIVPGVSGIATKVDLGSAGSFAVLAKSGITDTLSLSGITGDVGLSPGPGGAIVGFDNCTQVSGGAVYRVDAGGPSCAITDPALLGTAVTNMESAYSAATAQTPDYSNGGAENIGGQTLAPGVYSWGGALTIPADLTLDGQGDANAVWIFRTTGALTIEAGKKVVLVNGAQPANIFWVVAGETGLGAGSSLEGTVLDAVAITLGSGATVNGRALSQSTVTLDTSTVTVPAVRTGPTALFTFTNATGTVPLVVSFTDTSSADPAATITGWAWDFENDGIIDSTTRHPVYIYPAVTTYTPNLTVTDSFGAVATHLDTVTVEAAPVADFTFTPAGGAAPLVVIFTDTSTPAGQVVSWAWNFGDSDSTNATVRNPVHTYAAGGTYPVSLTVTDRNAATAAKTVPAAVVAQDTFEITVVNGPVSLSLVSGETTTNTAIEFYVNSTKGWEVTAYDADATGFMTDITSAAHLGEPFKVRQNSGNTYVNLPTSSISAIQIQTGAAEVSTMPYTLGIQQEVKLTDLVLPGGGVYHIVVTLTVGSL